MYYAALHPEEAAMLRKPDLPLPEKGWGELLLSETARRASARSTRQVWHRGRRRLFRNLTGGYLAESMIGRVWDKARKAALTEAEYASPLGKRPYDLRHACVSMWLAAGAPSTQCAEWAVLHQIYAKVIAGPESAARARIEQALGVEQDRRKLGGE
jgi:integrase